MTRSALLVENIHPHAVEILQAAGFDPVRREVAALGDNELTEAMADAVVVGVRSKSEVRQAALEGAKKLLAVGCFGIGTNQVDLETATRLGVPVFNAPFANSRSVAELTLACAVLLLRRIPEKMFGLREGAWQKTARGAYEARAKKLGIVGYGNIGSQLSVLASGLGMHVYYYDIEPKLRHGNARPVASLDELVELADVLTLHVPATPLTTSMINADRIARMKPGSVLINHARGNLVDVDALAAALRSGHLAGAAVDVFPVEPAGEGQAFTSPLKGLDNVILSPHIGGSTQEAQQDIGREVAGKLAAYVAAGATAGAVNFPEVAPAPRAPGATRILHIHENAPGVLSALNDIVSGAGLNIVAQTLATAGAIGYVVTDVDGVVSADALARAKAIPGSIRVRVLDDAGEAAAPQPVTA